MFIELIDLLRCTNDHDDTWLVASFKTVANRFVLEASLGCPSCSAQYSVSGGIADFSAGLALPSCEAERAAASHRREELATRAGAYLEATEPGATVVLGGVWAYAAQELSEMAEVRVLALNAPAGVKESPDGRPAARGVRRFPWRRDQSSVSRSTPGSPRTSLHPPYERFVPEGESWVPRQSPRRPTSTCSLTTTSTGWRRRRPEVVTISRASR